MLIATHIEETNSNNTHTPPTPPRQNYSRMSYSRMSPIINHRVSLDDFDTSNLRDNNHHDTTPTPLAITPVITPIIARTLFTDDTLSDTENWWENSDSDSGQDLQLYTPNTQQQIIKANQPSNTLVDIVKLPCHSNDCPICMEDLLQTDLFVTRCGHQFHGTCMIQHIKHNDNCPMCRGVLFTNNYCSKAIY
jgi:hypothetical protein